MILVHGFKISREKFFRDANRHGMIHNHPVSVKINPTWSQVRLVVYLVQGYRMMGKVIDRILIFCFWRCSLTV